MKDLDLNEEHLNPQNGAFGHRIKALDLDDEALNPKTGAFGPRIKDLDLKKRRFQAQK